MRITLGRDGRDSSTGNNSVPQDSKFRFRPVSVRDNPIVRTQKRRLDKSVFLSGDSWSPVIKIWITELCLTWCRELDN